MRELGIESILRREKLVMGFRLKQISSSFLHIFVSVVLLLAILSVLKLNFRNEKILISTEFELLDPEDFVDRERPSRVIWPLDDRCKRFDVKYGKNMNISFFISFPRSGNTWSRYLLEGATGIFTGSVYNEPVLNPMGFMGEGEDPNKGTVITVKSHNHQLLSAKVKNFTYSKSAFVLLIRNPQKSIISYWNFIKSKNHSFVYNAPNSTYYSEEFHEFVKEWLLKWKKVNEETLTLAKKLLVIFYEDLLEDCIREVTKIIHFLGFKAEHKRTKCLIAHYQGPAKRNHSEINPYTEEEMKEFEVAVSHIKKLLLKRGIDVPKQFENC